MKTTKKGDELESQFFAVFKREIAQGRFFADKNRCKIFLKKGYYSRDRKKNIVFDIAIEIYIPGQTTYSMLVLIECKNYNHRVPVDDIEEFYSKLEQVAGANVKGIVVSTNSFQEGSFTFAKSKGIGLIRYYPKRKIKWELTRSPSALVSLIYSNNQWLTASKGLKTETFDGRYFDCYCYSDETFTNSLRAFFWSLLSAGVDKDLKRGLDKIIVGFEDDHPFVEYREDQDIEACALSLLQSISYKEGPVPLNSICEFLKEEKGLEVTYEPTNVTNNKDAILGKITFSPLEIKIFRGFDQINERIKFTLAHEIGHLSLAHSRYMTSEYLDEVDLELENPAELGVKDIMRMEYQANFFGSCLLLPKNEFASDFFTLAESLGLRDRGFGPLYLDEQSCNIESYYRMTNMLKWKYQVSRQVVKHRLKKMGLLNERSSTWNLQSPNSKASPAFSES
ncbi:MAG TPA: ImmA/IrrE family metallo-endopeptidase [Pyrinomonadaceae bacterium]|nr:ImmA/IrrE family metallo-endopeptidase [Pyrinomonadaceae bacterium]